MKAPPAAGEAFGTPDGWTVRWMLNCLNLLRNPHTPAAQMPRARFFAAYSTGQPHLCATRTPCRGRFHIGPVCGGAGPRGRDKSRPYESILRFRPFGTTATARATVGRDALIPPHPAPPQCSEGGPWPSPTNRGRHGGPEGKHKPRGQPSSPCRGAHCAPGRPFRHAASFKRQPAVRQSLRHGLRPCHLPLTREAKPPQTPRCRTPGRGRCSHRPGKPRAAANTPGGYGTRPCEPRTISHNPGRPPRRGCVSLRFGV